MPSSMNGSMPYHILAVRTPPPPPIVTHVAAWGALVISCLTFIGASYLIYVLIQRGAGKLRVKLLLGMIISDVLLGIAGIVTTIMYLSGHALTTGSSTCTTFGFLLTSIIFTQHLWTLTIALATFALLRHPLSNVTTILEQYWLYLLAVIWGISLLQAGIWYHFAGFSSSAYLCYYAAAKDGSQLSKDLIQFIPRAFVFIVVFALYAGLFKFLRRPDTIQTSTEASTKDHMLQTLDAGRCWIHRKTFTQNDILSQEVGEQDGIPLPDVVEERPPWERLNIVALQGEGTSMDQSALEAATRMPLPQSPISQREMFVWPSIAATNEEAPSPTLADTQRKLSAASTSERTTVQSLQSAKKPSYDDSLQTATAAPTGEVPNPIRLPSVTDLAGDGGSDLGEGTQLASEESSSLSSHHRPRRQTLQEFFAQYQLTPEEALAQRQRNDNLRQEDRKQQSASSYINRQASLLMLYFPLAYLIVFAFSMVRLIYDMSTNKYNAFLSVISLWTVLSVGLVDALVFGLAEFLVRRRVRREVPDKFEPPHGRLQVI